MSAETITKIFAAWVTLWSLPLRMLLDGLWPYGQGQEVSQSFGRENLSGGTSPILFFLWLDVLAVCLSAAYHPIRDTGTNLRESRYISGARGTAGVGLSLINPQPSQAKVIPTIRLSQLSTAYGA